MNPLRLEGVAFGGFSLRVKRAQSAVEIYLARDGLESASWYIRIERLGNGRYWLEFEDSVEIGGVTYLLADSRLERDVLAEVFRSFSYGEEVVVDICGHSDVLAEASEGIPALATRVGLAMVLGGMCEVDYVDDKGVRGRKADRECLAREIKRAEKLLYSMLGRPRAFERLLEIVQRARVLIRFAG